MEWELRYAGLTKAEREAIEGLALECEGRLRTFTFLDPMANLLARSEEPALAPWEKDPGLALAGEQSDPWGTLRATRVTNTGQVGQRLQQAVAGSAGFRYCLSVQVRSAGGSGVTLFLRAGAAEEARACGAGAGWRLAWLPANLGGSEEEVECGLLLAPGASVDVFGMQLEAQPHPSAYKRTQAHGGVYPRARFRDDVLALTAHGEDNYAGEVAVVSPEEG